MGNGLNGLNGFTLSRDLGINVNALNIKQYDCRDFLGHLRKDQFKLKFKTK